MLIMKIMKNLKFKFIHRLNEIEKVKDFNFINYGNYS